MSSDRPAGHHVPAPRPAATGRRPPGALPIERPTAGARLPAVIGLLPLRGVWRYRGFVWGMVSRQFRARYLQSLLGSAWALLNPAAMIATYTVVFSQVSAS